MKANNYISKKEYKLLFCLTLFACVSAFVNLSNYLVEGYNFQVSQTQMDIKHEADGENIKIYSNYPPKPSLLLNPLLLTFAILSLRKNKGFILSSFFTSFPFLVFIFWLINTSSLISKIEVASSIKGSDQILFGADYFDYIVFFFVSILFFWQILILLRMLIKTLQKKSELP